MQEHFAFFQSYALAYMSLESLEERDKFIRKLISYGIDEVEPPDEGDQASLFFRMTALPIIRKGLKQRRGGQRGGLATGPSKARPGNRNASRDPLK